MNRQTPQTKRQAENPLLRQLSTETRAALAAVRVRQDDNYIDAMAGILSRAKNLASGLGSVADLSQGKEFPMDGNETAALAYAIAEQIEAAEMLIQGLFNELAGDSQGGLQEGAIWPR